MSVAQGLGLGKHWGGLIGLLKRAHQNFGVVVELSADQSFLDSLKAFGNPMSTNSV